MAQVTYLLGAGASAKAIPVVNDIERALEKLIKDIPEDGFGRQRVSFQDGIAQYRDRSPADVKEVRAAVIQAKSDFQVLLNGCRNHVSIDTFAKMLFLTRNAQYDQVKKTIVLFFEILKLDFGLDKRYDAFFASILKERYDALPDNINILSWNYDDQIELAYQRYLDSAGVSHQAPEQLLNMYCKGCNYRDNTPSNFNIIKINGNAQFLNSAGQPESLIPRKLKNKDELLIAYKKRIDDGDTPALTFSWDSPRDNLHTWIAESIKDTQALVVIGYSFPYFNREMDKFMLERMPKLHRIYIQDKNPVGVQERITAIRTDFDKARFRLVDNLDQFYLPNELG